MKCIKKVLTGILALAVVIVGAIILPSDTKASTTDVIYEQKTLSSYWSSDEKKIPVKDGYVFGGWYTSEDAATYTKLTEETLEAASDISSYDSNSYAKFVPSYVLSVKTQLEEQVSNADTREACSDAYLRLISSVDEGYNDYQNVGFMIHYNKYTGTKHADTLIQNVVTNKVYEQLTESNEETPDEFFGEASDKFTILRITEIPEACFELVIYVRPYWTTADGTQVFGMSRYVRVMDGYAENRYISIPVNLMVDGTEDDMVGVGQVQMTYPAGLTYVEVDSGVGYDSFVTQHSGDSTNGGRVTFLAKSCVPTDSSFDHNFVDVSATDHLFGCVWFKTTATESTAYECTFTTSFSNWHEELISVGAWDYTYKQVISNEVTE